MAGRRWILGGVSLAGHWTIADEIWVGKHCLCRSVVSNGKHDGISHERSMPDALPFRPEHLTSCVQSGIHIHEAVDRQYSSWPLRKVSRIRRKVVEMKPSELRYELHMMHIPLRKMR